MTLTVVAAAGATAVYFAGEAQHRRDRSDIVRWESRALPAARDAERVQRSVRASMRAADVASARATLQRDLAAIVAAAVPEIVRPAAAAYVDAIKETQTSLEAVGTPKFEKAQRRATAAFAAAEGAVRSLLCRANLAGCVRP